MTSSGVMAVILRYFAEFDSSRGALSKNGWRYYRNKSSRSLSHLILLRSFLCIFCIANFLSS